MIGTPTGAQVVSRPLLYFRFCLIDWMQYNEASGVPSLNARTIENVEVSAPVPTEQALRISFYKAVALFTRAYADIATHLTEAGYSDAEAAAIKGEVEFYAGIRASIKKHAGEALDIKPFEADMRHLLNTYGHRFRFESTSSLPLGRLARQHDSIQGETVITPAEDGYLGFRRLATASWRRSWLEVQPVGSVEPKDFSMLSLTWTGWDAATETGLTAPEPPRAPDP